MWWMRVTVSILLDVLLLLSGESGFDRSGVEEELDSRWVSGRGSKSDRSWGNLTPVQNWTKLKKGTSNYREKNG